jgi:hypothetical protein
MLGDLDILCHANLTGQAKPTLGAVRRKRQAPALHRRQRSHVPADGDGARPAAAQTRAMKQASVAVVRAQARVDENVAQDRARRAGELSSLEEQDGHAEGLEPAP